MKHMNGASIVEGPERYPKERMTCRSSADTVKHAEEIIKAIPVTGLADL
jgi:hypothetical protein